MRTVDLLRAKSACVVAILPVFSTAASYKKRIWLDLPPLKIYLLHPFIYYFYVSNVWILRLTRYLRVLHKGPMYPGAHPFKQIPLIWSHSPRQFPHVALHSLPNVPWLHAFWNIDLLNVKFKTCSMINYRYSKCFL